MKDGVCTFILFCGSFDKWDGVKSPIHILRIWRSLGRAFSFSLVHFPLSQRTFSALLFPFLSISAWWQGRKYRSRTDMCFLLEWLEWSQWWTSAFSYADHDTSFQMEKEFRLSSLETALWWLFHVVFPLRKRFRLNIWADLGPKRDIPGYHTSLREDSWTYIDPIPRETRFQLKRLVGSPWPICCTGNKVALNPWKPGLGCGWMEIQTGPKRAPFHS